MYDELTSWNNLRSAYKKASAGKRGHPNVAAFEYRLEDNLLRLQEELRAQTYQPGRYASFYIHEPKRRLISAAPFGDRVAHHALCNVIEPIFERSFIFDSYANRVGKGTHRALERCQEFARRYKYVWPRDLRRTIGAVARDHSSRHAPASGERRHSVSRLHGLSGAAALETTQGDLFPAETKRFDGRLSGRKDSVGGYHRQRARLGQSRAVWQHHRLAQSGVGPSGFEITPL